MVSDSTPRALEVYYRRLAELTPAERLDIAAALWVASDSLQRASMRMNFPDASEDEITFKIAVTRFGMELASKAYGKV